VQAAHAACDGGGGQHGTCSSFCAPHPARFTSLTLCSCKLLTAGSSTGTLPQRDFGTPADERSPARKFAQKALTGE